MNDSGGLQSTRAARDESREAASAGADPVDRSLLEAIPDALIVVDPSGKLLRVNSMAERLFGYSRSELLGEPVEMLVPPAIRERHRKHRERYLANPVVRAMSQAVGLQAIRKDGSLVRVDISLSPVPSPDGTLTVCAIRDVTERERSVEALGASETLFRMLANQASDGIFLSDAEGRYQAVNDAGCAILGYSRDELVGMTIADIVAADELGRLPDEIARLATGEPVKSEWRFVRRDGTSFQGEVNARMLGDSRLLAVLRDVTERKRREDEDLRARRFLEAVAKASPSWIYVFDIDDRTVRYLNRSILRDFGFSADMDPMTRLEESERFFPPEDLPRIPGMLEAWRALADDEVREDEYRIRRADGTYRWCLGRETVFARHPDGRVRQILGTLDDITERKHAMERLEESEERFRTMVQDLEVGVLLQDAATDEILLANRAAEEMLGLAGVELDRLSSHTWPYRLVRDDGTDYPRDALPSVAAARTGQPVRNRIVGSMDTRSGVCRWLQVTAMPRHAPAGAVSQVLVTMTDVTARLQAEAALIAAREEWEHSFNALTDWVCVLDRDGRVVRANRAMRERFEPSVGPLAGVHHRDIYDPGGHEGDDRCATVLAGGSPVEFTTSLGQSPGNFVVACYPLGESGGAVHVVRDNTRQHVLEEQLRQSQKMQAIGQLAGGIAHDFNNLLTVIVSCSDLAMFEAPPDAESLRESITSIRAAADRAALLTRQLLLFGRKGLLEEKLLDVNEIVQHAGQMLRRLIGEDIVVSTSLAPSLPPTRGDASQLEQVLLNLALNARDAMPKGGQLTIATGRASFTDDQCRADPNRRPGNFVRLSVSDTGSGMPAEVRAHLFEPFFTTKGPGKGTGLGLSTAYGYVQQVGGFIQLQSTVGAGSTFDVYLPVAEGDGHEAHPQAQDRGIASGSETILVVEDERDVRQVVVRSLVAHGFRVKDVASAAEALDVLAANGDQVRLLVTDIVMPEVSGAELTERARALRPGLLVLFMTRYSPENPIRQDLSTEGIQVLQKPFTPGTLVEKVREVLDVSR